MGRHDGLWDWENAMDEFEEKAYYCDDCGALIEYKDAYLYGIRIFCKKCIDTRNYID